MIKYLSIPKDNANDERVIVRNVIENGSKVTKDSTVIAELEGSKSVYEYYAEEDGFFFGLIVAGDEIDIASIFGLISSEKLENNVALENIKHANQQSIQKNENHDLKLNQSITKPALKMIEDYAIPLSFFNDKDVITKEDCENYLLLKSPVQKRPELEQKSPHKKIAIIGAGTGGMIALDIFLRDATKTVIGFYDDALVGKNILGYPILGPIDINLITTHFFEKKIFDALIVTIGSNSEFRDKIFNDLKNVGICFENAIHPSSIIGFGVDIGVCNVVAANVTVGAFTKLGCNNFISSGCIIEHHNTLGASNSFGPAVCTSGTVIIEDRIKFGTGIFIEPYLTIGSDCIIASGAIVTSSIPSGSILKSTSNYKLTKVN
jgi:acetyltransferase-like isoleucine patch superfamily enzyme